MQQGKLKIPKMNIEPFASEHDFRTRLFLQYSEIMEKTDAGNAVTEMLSNDPRVKDLEGKMISRGSGAQAFEVKTLAMWFLWCANEYGLESAEEHLNLFLDADLVSVINALWIIGVKVEQTICLDGGYEILPIENLPDSRDKEQFLQKRFDDDMQHHLVPSSAIIYPCKVKKAQKNDGMALNVEDVEFRQSNRRLYEIALLLNALDGVSCLPYHSTSYAFPTTPFGPFNSSGGGSPIYDVLGHNVAQLATNDRTIIDVLISNYDRLPNSEKKRFQVILNRLSQAKRRIQIEDKILDLGITIEMLLLEDNKNNDQLSLSFRLRGSWLLGETSEDRMKIYKQLNEIYDYRSQVAHSGILCKGDIHKISDVMKSFPEYQSLAEKIFRKILNSGKPDWKKLVLNANS
jgi:hypothetical protein